MSAAERQTTAYIATGIGGVRWALRCEGSTARLLRNGAMVLQEDHPCPQGIRAEVALLDAMIAKTGSGKHAAMVDETDPVLVPISLPFPSGMQGLKDGAK